MPNAALGHSRKQRKANRLAPCGEFASIMTQSGAPGKRDHGVIWYGIAKMYLKQKTGCAAAGDVLELASSKGVQGPEWGRQGFDGTVGASVARRGLRYTRQCPEKTNRQL